MEGEAKPMNHKDVRPRHWPRLIGGSGGGERRNRSPEGLPHGTSWVGIPSSVETVSLWLSQSWAARAHRVLASSGAPPTLPGSCEMGTEHTPSCLVL